MACLVLRSHWLFFLVAPLPSCVQLTTGDGTSGRAMQRAADAGSLDGRAQGSACITNSQATVILCERIDACPGVVVDPGAFPDCGFRLNVSSPVAIECLCSNALCPLGATASCDEAAKLLAVQNALLVCGQIADGRCVDLSTPSTTGAAACDKGCLAQCAGAPSCFQLCGC